MSEKHVMSIKGKEVTFEGFAPLEKNLIKILIVGPNDEREGIWACMNTIDKKAYEEDFHDTEDTPYRFVILRNESLFAIPWGAYLPVKFRGRSRPECMLEWLDGGVTVNQTETIPKNKG